MFAKMPIFNLIFKEKGMEVNPADKKSIKILKIDVGDCTTDDYTGIRSCLTDFIIKDDNLYISIKIKEKNRKQGKKRIQTFVKDIQIGKVGKEHETKGEKVNITKEFGRDNEFALVRINKLYYIKKYYEINWEDNFIIVNNYAFMRDKVQPYLHKKFLYVTVFSFTGRNTKKINLGGEIHRKIEKNSSSGSTESSDSTDSSGSTSSADDITDDSSSESTYKDKAVNIKKIRYTQKKQRKTKTQEDKTKKSAAKKSAATKYAPMKSTCCICMKNTPIHVLTKCGKSNPVYHASTCLTCYDKCETCGICGNNDHIEIADVHIY